MPLPAFLREESVVPPWLARTSAILLVCAFGQRAYNMVAKPDPTEIPGLIFSFAAALLAPFVWRGPMRVTILAFALSLVSTRTFPELSPDAPPPTCLTMLTFRASFATGDFPFVANVALLAATLVAAHRTRLRRQQ